MHNCRDIRQLCHKNCPTTSTAQSRLAGYQQALATHRIALNEDLIIHGDSGVPDGYQGCQALKLIAGSIKCK
ncbi:MULTISPECIES: hypothetical protein [Yersinia]|uniref:hypothetical protein n=1 Tax=Yersinia TaxID=629 RepID=UPI0006795705|nr:MULTISPECIES: hypothetical protein [Yersinia]MCB5299828.1 hypothetical protein [Yersinia intermedia]MDA5492697.1 hypothetical protein [Yersinia intermedia]MDA5513053.1 hypothetical protein [Yersinia intermedia]OVZ77323.1 hypothetical protein CBW55_03730 [Yersinia intermedia]